MPLEVIAQFPDTAAAAADDVSRSRPGEGVSKVVAVLCPRTDRLSVLLLLLLLEADEHET